MKGFQISFKFDTFQLDQTMLLIVTAALHVINEFQKSVLIVVMWM